MTVRFDGKVAIVTGAGAGLGRSHARLLASRGAKVVVNDPGRIAGGGEDFAADRVVAEIRAEGGDAVANHASVADRDGAASIVQTALDHFGGIHIVVNNAGILRDKTFAKMTLDEFELVLAVHLLGTVYVTKAAWPHLVEQKWGRIVLTSSGSGLVGSYGQSNYGAAKAGMIGLMNNLKNEGSKFGIRVNTISPVAATGMTDGLMEPQLLDILKPEQISPAVAWMCSEACDVTGEIIAAGGGFFARVKTMRTAGAVLGGGGIATIEDFAAGRDEIFDLSTAAPYTSTIDPDVRRRLGLT